MTQTVQRRGFLASLGAGVTSLSGCVGNLLGGGDDVDRTVYVGAYHWGFVVFDGYGDELERVDIQRGDVLRIVSFNTAASRAVQSLPASIRESLPNHEALEERNEERIPSPSHGDFRELLEEANERNAITASRSCRPDRYTWAAE